MAITLSPKEEALIIALRIADEIPDNAQLWYCVGRQESAKKIADIVPEEAKRSTDMASTVRKEYWKRVKEIEKQENK